MTNSNFDDRETARPRRAMPPADDPDATRQAAGSFPSDETYPEYQRPQTPDATAAAGSRGIDATQPITPSETPRLLGGRYELADVLGRGGMAEVRRAYDTRLGRPVAVKELRNDLAADPTFQARFRREAQSAAGLNHPNIVAVYDTGEETDPQSGLGIPYIVMELVEGHTLRDVLRDGRKILPERALEISQGVLDALSYSHKAGIIHRDIKPANVMLTPQGTVKVMDFGIARAIADTSATMTQTAAVIGTAQYLSPEQARGETVDARSDLYSAGCLLYELLVGRPPFIGDSPVSVAYQHVRELPVPPSQLDPVITPEIDAIVLKSLAKDAGERYQTAREMSDDIGRVLNGMQPQAAREVVSYVEPVAPTRPSPVVPEEPEPEEEEEEKKSPVGWILGILAVLAVALIAGGWWFLSRPPAPQGPTMVAVPNVMNQPRSDAATKIASARLVPKVIETQGADDSTVGTVTRQAPVGGTQVAENSEVEVEVNVGPKKGAIPSGLVGKNKDEVLLALQKAGFNNVNAVEAESEPEDSKADQVLSVEPREGTQVPLGSAVTVKYATGKVAVPDWIDRATAFVQEDAKKRNLKIKIEERETSDTTLQGRVISTDPASGTKIDRKQTITVVVGKAPKPTPTPSPVPSPTRTTSAPPTPTNTAEPTTTTVEPTTTVTPQ